MVRQAKILWAAAGGAGGETVLHFDNVVTNAGILSAYNAFAAAIAPALASSTNLRLNAEVRDYDTATGGLTDITSLTPPAQVNGSGGASAVPNAAQGLIRFRTGLIIGRRLLQGRLYVPGMSSSTQLGTGEVNTTGLNALNAAGAALVTPQSVVVWHRPVNGAGGQSSYLDTATGWSEYAVQRRRRA